MGHARGRFCLSARAFSRSTSVVRALPCLCDLFLEVRHVNGQLLDFREARGAAARRLIGRVGVGLELLGDPGLGLGRRGGAGREEDHFGLPFANRVASTACRSAPGERSSFEVVRGA